MWNKYTETFAGYFIYRAIDDANNIIYVGKTTNLKERLYMHKWNKDVKNYWFHEARKIEYFRIDSEYKMSILETHYISKFKPKYNTFLKYDYIELYDFNHDEWLEFQVKDFWKKKIYSKDILVCLIRQYANTMRGKKIAKGAIFSLDERLSRLKDNSRANLWKNPQIQQLVEDGVINIKGRTVEFL